MTTVLIVDDDRSHLKLYSWILEHGGFRPLTAFVGSNSVELPSSKDIDVIALDYRLNSQLTAVDVAQQLHQTYPEAPILVLSEMMWMPDDVAPFAASFVRKGEPEMLLNAVRQLASGQIPAIGEF